MLTQQHLIALGHMKKGPLQDLFLDYQKRMASPLKVSELEYKKPTPNLKEEEGKLILSAIPHGALVIALDERGKSMKSPELARFLGDRDTPVTWIIGGADGLSEGVRERSDRLLSFGTNTWPHMMVRVMLIEQLYRAQQILKGHPYHRD